MVKMYNLVHRVYISILQNLICIINYIYKVNTTILKLKILDRSISFILCYQKEKKECLLLS